MRLGQFIQSLTPGLGLRVIIFKIATDPEVIERQAHDGINPGHEPIPLCTNGTQTRCMTLAARPLLTRPRVGIHTFDKLRRIGVPPIRMHLLQLRADLLPGDLDWNPLTFEGGSLRSNGGDQLPFRGDE
jgi:hypothetical protein